MFEFRETTAPYPGLRPFEPHESEIFFGREGHTDRLLEILQRERFLAVIGPSGCGKSSLVRAGLLPGLASGALGTGSDWRLALLRPGGQPMLALAQALLGPHALGHELVGKDRLPKDAEDVTADVALVAAELRLGPAGLAGLLQAAAARRPEGAEPFNLLILVDQFEELFTYPDAGDEAEDFVQLLLAARGACTPRNAELALPHEAGEAKQALHAITGCRIYVALTMRTDFLGNCVDFLELPEAINRAQYLTPRLNGQDLGKAIAGPARVFGGEVDEALVPQLIKAISHDSDQLPILQHALALLWREAAKTNPDAPLITEACLQAVGGGIDKALDHHAEEVWRSLTATQQALAETLFRAITERRETGGQDVRRPQSLDAIARWANVPADDFKPVIGIYATPEVSFLHYGRELTDTSVIDLTHEALIRQWDRLRGWVAEEHRRGEGYRRWTQRAEEYRTGAGGLLTGGDLARALEWWNPSHPPLPEGASLERSRMEDRGDEGSSHPEQVGQSRHTGRDAGIQATDGDLPLAQNDKRGAGEPAQPETKPACPSWQPSPHWASRYSDSTADKLAEEFEQTRQFLIDSRDAEQQEREKEKKRLEQEAEKERQRAEMQLRLAESERQRADQEKQQAQTQRQLAEEAKASEGRARRLTKIVAWVALFAIGLTIAAAYFWRQAQTAEQQRTASLFESQLTHGSLLARVEDYAEERRVLAESLHLDPDIPAARRHARNLLAGYAEMMGGRAGQVYTGAGAALVGGVAVSPDGKLLAAAGERGTLVLFDADSGKLLRRLEGHDPKAGNVGGVRSVVFDPQGRWLFSGSEDGRIIRWSLPEGNKLGEWQAPASVSALALSPDGATLASGGTDNRITLWSAADGKNIRSLEGHTGGIATPNGLAFSPNGNRLASASYDKTARLWDWRMGKSLLTLEGHSDGLEAVAFSPDGKLLATASNDKQVILWDIDPAHTATFGHAMRVLRGHQNTVFGLAFNADGSQLLSASRDNTLRLWDVTSGITRRIYQGHEAGLSSVAVRGDRVYTAANDVTVRRWPLATPQQWVWETGGTPKAAAISPAGSVLAMGMEDGGLRLHGLPDGKLLAGQADAHGSGGIKRIAFNSDGSLLATAGMDGKAKLWRVDAEGQRLTLLHTLEGHKDAVHAVAFSPDGSRLATASYDGQIGLFDAATGQGRLFPAHDGKVESVAFSPDGKRLLSAGYEDRRVRLWNLDDLNHPPQEIAQTQDKLLWASLSPDGREIAAVGREAVVSLYNLNLASPGPARRLVGHEQSVYRAIFSPDGRQLATVSWDMTVRLWDLDSQRLLFTLRLPTEFNNGPLWDFDFRCTADGDCWIAVPLTIGRLALYRLPYEHPPGPQ